MTAKTIAQLRSKSGNAGNRHREHNIGLCRSIQREGGLSWRDEVTGTPGDEEVANARLIAAAPELLRACKAALSALEHNPHFRENAPTIELTRAAIAKAEGK